MGGLTSLPDDESSQTPSPPIVSLNHHSVGTTKPQPFTAAVDARHLHGGIEGAVFVGTSAADIGAAALPRVAEVADDTRAAVASVGTPEDAASGGCSTLEPSTEISVEGPVGLAASDVSGGGGDTPAPAATATAAVIGAAEEEPNPAMEEEAPASSANRAPAAEIVVGEGDVVGPFRMSVV